MSDKQRLIMISLDAVGRRDMEFMKTLPNFSRLVSEGAFCDRVYSVYPSLTYPAHTSIMTGRMPKNHGIVGNTRFQPSRNNPDWLYKRKFIKGTNLADEAVKKGMSVAAFLWPVMGGAKIDYNIPEVLVTRKWQTQVTACLLNGTPKYLLDVNKRFGHIRDGINQPALDDFLMESVLYTIDKYDPDMMLIHLTDVDTNRHNFGTTGPEIEAALRRHDERLGRITDALSRKRSMDKTTVIVLGDHCQVDMHTIVYLNTLFKERGLLTVKNGVITDYKVISKSADGSAYVYVNPKYAKDEEFIASLADLLNEIRSDSRLGIEEIFTNEEASEMGADADCFVMIEGKPGYYFLNNADVLTEPVAETKNHKMFATHGCLPTKEENITFFAASGYKIKKGVFVESMHLWDEGPTIARIIDTSLGSTDGHIVHEILDI